MSKSRFEFRPDTPIQEALDLSPEVARAFERLGLKCFDCPAAPIEDLRLAALFHEKDLAAILEELNRLDLPAAKKKSE